MATHPREFFANVPQLLTVACIGRLRMLELPGMFEEFKRLVAQYAPRCKVEVICWSYMANHAHLIVRQLSDGVAPDAKTGIAAFMRNMWSILAKRANQRMQHDGHFVADHYHAVPLHTAADLYRAIAYVHGQAKHHRVKGSLTSAETLEKGVPDGIVELFLDLLPDDDGPVDAGAFARRCERLRTFIQRVIQAATDEERRQRQARKRQKQLPGPAPEAEPVNPWTAATHRIGRELGIALHTRAASLILRPIADFIGQAAIAAARQRALDYRWQSNEVEEHEAPRPGEPIDIRITYRKSGARDQP